MSKNYKREITNPNYLMDVAIGAISAGILISLAPIGTFFYAINRVYTAINNSKNSEINSGLESKLDNF